MLAEISTRPHKCVWYLTQKHQQSLLSVLSTQTHTHTHSHAFVQPCFLNVTTGHRGLQSQQGSQWIQLVSQTLWNKVCCSLILTLSLSFSLSHWERWQLARGGKIYKPLRNIPYLYLGWTLHKIHSCVSTQTEQWVSDRTDSGREDTQSGFFVASFQCAPSYKQYHTTLIKCCWQNIFQSRPSMVFWSLFGVLCQEESKLRPYKIYLFLRQLMLKMEIKLTSCFVLMTYKLHGNTAGLPKPVA